MMNDYQSYKKLSNKIMKKSKISECLWSNNCDEAIGSHSIQNNGILSVISENGHIYSFQSKPSEDKLDFFLQKKGKNDFSVFNGFCKIHDKKIFEPIEDKKFINSSEQKYLFAFRALAREYHMKKESVLLHKEMLKHIIEENSSKLSLTNEDNMILLLLEDKYKSSEQICSEFRKLFNVMKKDIEKKNYNRLNTYTFILPRNYPIATNTCFIPYRDLNENLLYTDEEYDEIQTGINLPIVMLNVFPKENKTYILFSYFKKDVNKLRVFKKQINTDVENRVSKLILQYAENTCFSPSYIRDYFSEYEINEIRLAFEENLYQDALKEQVRSPNLFKDKKWNS